MLDMLRYWWGMMVGSLARHVVMNPGERLLFVLFDFFHLLCCKPAVPL